MKKLGVITVIVLIAVVGISRSRSTKSQINNIQPDVLKESSSAQIAPASAQTEVKPGIAQLLDQVSEDKSEATAEQSSFQNRLEDIMVDMPTLTTQGKPKPDADGHIHGSLPEELVEARVLGQLRKVAFENPQYAARSQIVYAGCAEHADFSNAVRAVCFMRALELSIKIKNPQTISALEVPTQIRSLAQKLISKGKL